MTPEEINRAIAEKIMGFEKQGHTSWRDPNNEVWFIDEWNPYERIEHAWMVLEKFPIWKVTKFPDSNYEVVIGVGRGYKGGAIDIRLEKTICLAALEAVKK